MEKDQLVEFESRCIQEEAPYCQAACPIHVDARSMCAAWADQGAGAARLILERTMPLPALTAHMCEAPCLGKCLRDGFGGPLALGDLERAAMAQAPRQAKLLPMPPKAKRVAVLGGGAAGLAAAWDLAKKGWPVDWYTASPDSLNELARYQRTCPPEHLADELAFLDRLGAKRRVLPAPDAATLNQLLEEYDAVLADCLALDPASLGLDRSQADRITLQVPQGHLFLAGGAGGAPSYINDLCQGRQAATSIDRLLRGASLTAERKGEGPQPTRLETETSSLAELAAVAPVDPVAGYTADEAKREAERCLRCQCMQCVRRCVYLQEYGAYPKAYARQVYNNEAIVKGHRTANPLIISCSLCGQCTEICPHDFSMADLCLGARQRMNQTGHMPPSAHFFALKEMDSAWEPWAYLARHQPGQQTSAWLFFPGCQLAGVRPGQVRAAYGHLCAGLSGGVGLMLACCGAPAHWAGQSQRFQELLARLRQAWQDLDCPRIITGCTSCLGMFREHLPQVDAVSLWEVWQKLGAPPAVLKSVSPLAVEDPCTTRNQPGIQDAARDLALHAGCELLELEGGGRLTECCGYGGLMAEANPALGDKVIKNRAAQSPADYLTYCVMCRERLAGAEKRALHLLDLYFPPDPDPAALPPSGLSQRWDQRRRLREALAGELWSDAPEPDSPWSGVLLRIPSEVQAVMDKRRILAEDLRQVIHQADQEGQGFRDTETGRVLVCGRLGPVTYWVEYSLKGDEHLISRAWSHRMVVERART